MYILLMTMMGWFMKWLVPVEDQPNQWGDRLGHKQFRSLSIHRAIRSGRQDYFTLAADFEIVRLTGEWGDPDPEYGCFDGLKLKWQVNSFYEVVRHIALNIVYNAKYHQALNDSHQEVEWATLGPIRLRVTDNITIDHSDVEFSITVGPQVARLMIGYRWAVGEDVICSTGFFGRTVWRNSVSLFGA